ncbi:cornifelin homolog A-like [Dendronephthya gigantea]|uniref:cornifelin homolog A-like n=1 Tax=Dendronephthya gigantea TaxID=151771 RepID=UPI001069CA91|nr:cornifelin homolog A-like [Dendronephthya gigantea]
MYNRMSEPGFDEDKGGMPQPEIQQPPPYPQPGMGPIPMQQPPAFQQPMQQPSHMHSSNTNTTVVIQQQPQQVVIQGPRAWSTGICSCFDDCGDCLFGFFCPCIHECNLSSAAGECCCVARCCPIALRTKIRTKHNIAGSIMDDCCTVLCCGPCATCQMSRELKIHGI